MQGIYIIFHKASLKCYVGRDKNLGSRAKKHLSLKCPECRLIHEAIDTHGCDAFHVELIPLRDITFEELVALEEQMIIELAAHRSLGGYNISKKGAGRKIEKIPTGKEIL